MYPDRVVSGMRPTGTMHLGHYHGALKNWIKMQSEQPCLFFVADWHALTTHYDDPTIIERSIWDMLIDWLAAGVDPSQATLFIQSKVPEHAELHLLLSMATPLGWLERVPTYKDQIDNLTNKDLATYGFLGYPLLQAADVLIYRASQVPVGDDQVPHIEMMREIARRFNHLYGKEKGFEEKAMEAVKKLGSKRAKLYLELRTEYQQEGKDEALEQAQAMLDDAQSLSMIDRERLFGYLEGSRKLILVEPQAKLTVASRLPGLDGRKMSKSYGNAIALREDKASVTKKVRTMPTDPARVRRTDAGRPEQVPGVAAARSLFRRRHARLGGQGLHHGRHRLPRMQAAGDRRHHRASRSRCTSAPSNTWTIRRWCAPSSPTAATRPASWRRKPCATCARRWAWHTLDESSISPGWRASRRSCPPARCSTWPAAAGATRATWPRSAIR